MKLHGLLLAIVLTILSSTDRAASNEEAILGRWYYTGALSLDDEGRPLDISEDQIVFHGYITYQTEIVGVLGKDLLFKITGREIAEEDLKRIEEENLRMDVRMTAEQSVSAMFGCGSSGVATYIIAEPLGPIRQFDIPSVMLNFYYGDQTPTSRYNYGVCLGQPFMRRSVVKWAY